jgi:YaiO family outer membrane protein
VRRFLFYTLVLAALLLSAAPARADILAEARALSSSGHRPDAIKMLENYLKDGVDDPDARVLYGLMLSWDGRYDDARKQFEAVLSKRPDYSDAITGLINVELWSAHPDRAEQLASQAIERKGPNALLLFAQAKALRSQNRDRDALEVLQRLLSIDPLNQAALEAERDLRESLNQWRLGYSHTYEWFGHGSGPWNQNDLMLTRATPVGSVTATFSRAERYGLHSNLSEITFYPHIRDGTYGYLGFGYSYDGTLFPNYRIGAEIFQSLPHGFEGSVGYRRFGFSGATSMYTASAGKYLGKWLVTTRTFLTPDALGVTKSVSVSARRFFSHTGDYIDFRLGTGPSPFDPRSQDELQSLKAFSGYVQMRKSISPHFQWDLLIGAALEDRLYRVGVQHYVFASSMYYRF